MPAESKAKSKTYLEAKVTVPAMPSVIRTRGIRVRIRGHKALIETVTSHDHVLDADLGNVRYVRRRSKTYWSAIKPDRSRHRREKRLARIGGQGDKANCRQNKQPK